MFSLRSQSEFLSDSINGGTVFVINLRNFNILSNFLIGYFNPECVGLLNKCGTASIINLVIINCDLGQPFKVNEPLYRNHSVYLTLYL